MAKTKYGDEVPPEWMSEEATKAASQAATGVLIEDLAGQGTFISWSQPSLAFWN